jgi:hypothetical protein
MPAQRKLTDRTKGMFAGQATDIGQYDDSNMGLASGLGPYEIPGSTRGEQLPSTFAFNQWPYMVSGQTNYDPSSLQPGSNLNAVYKNLSAAQQRTRQLAKDAGFDDKATGNPSGLNGMPSN